MIFEHLNQFAQSSKPLIISKGDLGLTGTSDKLSGGDVAAVLNLVYIVAGIVAVIIIIIGGIRYASSNGDSNGVQSAKNTIMYAVIGLVVVIIAAAITNFVIELVARGGAPS